MQVSDFSPFSARRLDPVDLPEARRLADAAGVHGIYVRNSLDQGEKDILLAVHGAETMLGLIYFGHRGNLIIVGCQSVNPQRLAEAIDRSSQAWRIALGSESIIAALAGFEAKPALVDRTQLYYSITPERVAMDRLHPGVRLAERKDLRLLFDAALQLNSSDLNVEDWRVNKSWLKESIKNRVKQGQTFVIGQLGDLQCKVDVGSAGQGGIMLEGVYTRPQARARGLATSIVATVAERFLSDYSIVCLHVDSENHPARRAYQAAGMELDSSCRLLLRD